MMIGSAGAQEARRGSMPEFRPTARRASQPIRISISSRAAGPPATPQRELRETAHARNGAEQIVGPIAPITAKHLETFQFGV